MKNLNFFTASLLALVLSIFACSKPEIEAIPTEEPTVKTAPTLPDASRIIIHFGHMVPEGCLYSFSDCIYIGWGSALRQRDFPEMTLENADAAQDWYGDVFPLADDAEVNIPIPGSNGSGQKTRIAAGFYPIRQTPTGPAVIFLNDNPQAVAPLVNAANPQDKIGGLHNLAMQAILTPENRAALKAFGSDEAAARKFITEKAEAFLAGHNIKLQDGEAKKVAAARLPDDYDGDFAATLSKSGLSQKDQNALAPILAEVSAMEVKTTQDLSRFVSALTKHETSFAQNPGALDNPKLVLSTLSVLKHSRYFWFWKSVSTGNQAQMREKWWIADVKGLLTGGILTAIVDSIAAALK